MAIYIMTEDDLKMLLSDAARVALDCKENYSHRRYQCDAIESAVWEVMEKEAPQFKVLTAGNVGLKLG